MCPPPCHSPAPSQCADGDIVCDNGSNAGCWMGDYCMPEGSWVFVVEKYEYKTVFNRLDVSPSLSHSCSISMCWWRSSLWSGNICRRLLAGKQLQSRRTWMPISCWNLIKHWSKTHWREPNKLSTKILFYKLTWINQILLLVILLLERNKLEL